jgi:hypothetical protein
METADKTTEGSGSYRSILKSTSLIGGASFINILISMIRTKFVAILLGPSGVGLLGLYSLRRNTTGMSLWMKVPAAIYASGQAKLGL